MIPHEQATGRSQTGADSAVVPCLDVLTLRAERGAGSLARNGPRTRQVGLVRATALVVAHTGASPPVDGAVK